MPFQDLIRYGVNTQGNNYIADNAKNFADAFEAGEDRANKLEDRAYVESERQRIADEREQKEADAFYGDTYIPPTGQEGYDAGIEAMSREWKKSYADLKAQKKRGDISNEEYVRQKHEIRNRAQELKGGQAKLLEFQQTYQKALQEGQLSGSTPANIRLLGQALEDGSVSIDNVDGRPTVVGTLADGEKVQIDMGALSSGAANLRINQKVDTPGLVDNVAKGLEAYKTRLMTEHGFSQDNLGWEQVQDRANHDINELLNNESTVQAIAADELGLNSEQIKQLGPDGVRAQVRDNLLKRVQQDYFPIQGKLDKFTGVTGAQQLAAETQRRGQDLSLQARQSRPTKGQETNQNRQTLVHNLTSQLQATIGSDGTFNQATVDALQGQLGGNITDIEYDSNRFTPWKQPEIIIRTKDGEKIRSNNPQALVDQIATAKFGDEAVADTANQINTQINPTEFNQKDARSKYNY